MKCLMPTAAILVALILISLGSISFGETQSPTLNNIPVDTEQETTISVKKGPPSAQAGKKVWEIQNGTSEIAGDPELMEKEARQNWKKACESWKKELKELNTDNKIISMSCNSPKCEKATGALATQIICKSIANFTLKVRMLE